MKYNFSFITSSLFGASRATALAVCALAMVACGDDPTSNDTPAEPAPTKQISKVVEWMDGRLQKEYYWMDEYNEKRSSFDLTLSWDEYLDATLGTMTTNGEDGGYYETENGKERDLYSSITCDEQANAVASATRADFPTIEGYGIEISPYVVSIEGIDDYGEDDYGYVIEHIYPGSKAEELGLKRGDTIMKIGNTTINDSNYQTLIDDLRHGKTATKVEVYSYNEEKDDYETLSLTLSASAYEENPVAYSGILELDKNKFNMGDKKIGYLSYLSFEKDFDNKLIDAVAELVDEGATDIILDLRANGGGHVTSSVLLASMLLDESYVGKDKIYAHTVHHPDNKVYKDEDYCLIKEYSPKGGGVAKDIPNLGMEKVWIICSELSASASEMVIVGLRGLDVEVELVGNVTEGKNYGMEVTFFPGPGEDNYDEDGKRYTFAPITFKNENGKGFSDYGDGITPEHNLYAKYKDTSLSKELRSACGYFPVPITVWGDVLADVALCETVLQIDGRSLFSSKSSAQAFSQQRVSTRAGAVSMPQRTSLKVERTDLKSRGMILLEQDIQ